ncbi:MAG TPA: hypothetical protein VHM48_03675, partial [Candidatus Limnocylindrales bacterium]|nr:hypothetical protein [Candidatus Limnocylindrales bacterium]
RARPAQTHPCARCGAPVGLDVGLCERCNPLGLKDSASSQVHGSVLLAVGLAIAGLAIAAHFAVAGIGPFTARVTAMAPGASAGVLIATIEARNDGQATGSATCRLTDPLDPALIHSTIVYTPRIAPGETIAFVQEVSYGSPDRLLAVVCNGP